VIFFFAQLQPLFWPTCKKQLFALKQQLLKTRIAKSTDAKIHIFAEALTSSDYNRQQLSLVWTRSCRHSRPSPYFYLSTPNTERIIDCLLKQKCQDNINLCPVHPISAFFYHALSVPCQQWQCSLIVNRVPEPHSFLTSIQGHDGRRDLRRQNKCAIVNSRRVNHKEVQSVTAVEWFRRKRVAVYPLHIFVLGVTKHKTIIQREVTLASGRILQLQSLNKGILTAFTWQINAHYSYFVIFMQ
jgi:hypothetical protein